MGRKGVESRTVVLLGDSRYGGYGSCFLVLVDVVEDIGDWRVSRDQRGKKEVQGEFPNPLCVEERLIQPNTDWVVHVHFGGLCRETPDCEKNLVSWCLKCSVSLKNSDKRT